jgi:hypothetical protein
MSRQHSPYLLGFESNRINRPAPEFYGYILLSLASADENSILEAHVRCKLFYKIFGISWKDKQD